jgi:hypothetical protein
VAIRRREELKQAVAHATGQVADRRLAVRGPHQVGALGELRQRLGTHLRRPAAEAAVGRLQLARDLHGVDGHRESSRFARGATNQRWTLARSALMEATGY